MPKQKTRKSILKRFKITGKKRVFRGHQAARHRRSHKSGRRIRTFSKMVEVKSRQAKIVKKLI